MHEFLRSTTRPHPPRTADRPIAPTLPLAARRPHGRFAAVALAATVGLLAACGSPTTGKDVASSDGVALPASLQDAAIDGAVVVAGSTANTPEPQLSPMASAVLGKVLAAGRTVSVVRVDATPTLADNLGLRELGGTAAGNATVTRANLAKIARAIDGPPDADGADYLGGVLMAADAARGSGAAHPLVIQVGSGLSDSGMWDLTVPGMLGAEPSEVVAALGAAVTPDRLAGVVVLLSGVGWTTGGVQKPLSDALRSRVQALWVGVLEAMGATVVVDPQPFTQAAVATSHTVRPVEIAVPTAAPVSACAPREVVLDQTSDVSFVADQDVFVDATAAGAAVRQLAATILADDAVTVVLRGTTADAGDLDAQRALGLRRALVIRDALIAAGVPAARFTQVVGVGSDFPEYVRPDRDDAGALLPGPAALNRSVRATLSYAC